MTITTILNKNDQTKKELLQLSKKAALECKLKTLLCLAAIVGGIALIVFLNILDFGVGFILLGAALMGYSYWQHRQSSSLFTRAAAAIPPSPQTSSQRLGAALLYLDS